MKGNKVLINVNRARYECICSVCGLAINKGEPYTRESWQTKGFKRYHNGCVPPIVNTDISDSTETLFDKIADMPLVTEINLEPKMDIIEIVKEVAAETVKNVPETTIKVEEVIMTPIMQTIKKQVQMRDAKGHFIKKS